MYFNPLLYDFIALYNQLNYQPPLLRDSIALFYQLNYQSKKSK